MSKQNIEGGALRRSNFGTYAAGVGSDSGVHAWGRHGFSLIGFLGNMQVSGSKERERVHEEVAVHEQSPFFPG
jgi:hypothetical protein